jgi:predicted enzyme related to lactoylglutathione lyase
MAAWLLNAIELIARLDRAGGAVKIARSPPIAPAILPQTPPAMIKGIKLVSVPTNDQDRALQFWTEKMGFVVHTDQPFDGNQRWIELRIASSDAHLVLFTTDDSRAQIGKFSSVSFFCDSVEKTYEELNAKGVEFVSPPKKAEWGTAAIFKDLDGNMFVLSSR